MNYFSENFAELKYKKIVIKMIHFMVVIKVGNSYIKQENSAKLLGVMFNDRQNWSTQIRGQNGVVSNLNKRLFAIKRLKNHINKTSLSKVNDGLFTSKINYGVQLYGKVRLTQECPKSKVTLLAKC